MCGHADASGDVDGWRFVRRLGDSMGSLWAPVSLLSDDLGRVGQQDSRPLQLPAGKSKGKQANKAPSSKASAASNELGVDARTKANQNLSKQLELTDAHRRLLMDKRGLSGAQVAKLEREGFRSIDHGQRFPGVEGPGFLSGGQYNGPAGLLIPARNDRGEIVA